jgi:ABC-type phosphate/phosphonate transport system substrate-binding protein
MRDTDQDLTSVIVVREDSPYKDVADLKGETVGTGAIDSPQATLIPSALLRERGLRPGEEVAVRRFDVGVGLHGDHIGGERDAARALVAGDVDAACVIDGNHLAFANEGALPSGSTRIVGRTALYDHCNMTVLEPDDPAIAQFGALLLSMSYADADVRPLLDLEGLKQWQPGRVSGYDALTTAVDELRFYDVDGDVTAVDYRP